MVNTSSLTRALILLLCVVSYGATTSAQTPRRPQYVNMQEGARWDVNNDGSTTIRVCWENPAGYNTETQWVREAIEKTWQSEANVEFAGWDQCSGNGSGIRILIKDSHPHTNGLGKVLNGVEGGMELNFTFKNFKCGFTKENCIKFIAVHEFGHALGMAHEQNRKDCTCDEPPQGADGGLYITECDMNSVMNYCNERWNNYGVLSNDDKKGIQAVYGLKVKKPIDNSSQGLAYVTDSLGDGQLWENVYVEIGTTGQFFLVNGLNPTQTRAWAVPETATYQYRVWSYTMHSELVLGVVSQVPRWGYGQGAVTLEKGKTNSFTLFIENQPNAWNVGGYWNLTIKPSSAMPSSAMKDTSKQVTLKEIELSFRSSLFDDTIRLANSLLQATPDVKEAHAYLGFALLTKKDFDGAVAHLERAVVLGEPITLPVKRLREPLLGHGLDDASVTITPSSVIVKTGKTYYEAGFSALSDYRLTNYNNQCPVFFLKGTFVETSEKSEKRKQVDKQFNLFPPSATLQQVRQGNLFYNLAACNDDGTVPITITKTLVRVMVRAQ